VLSDVGQSVGKAFGIVYAFTDELRSVHENVPEHRIAAEQVERAFITPS
jgi:hypothetical protein